MCVFPLIGWDSPVCDLRFSADVCGVFLVANIQSDYLQPLRLHLLILWLNDLFRIQSTKRALKPPWPPPGLLFVGGQSGKRWCILMVLISLVAIVCGWICFFDVQIFQQKEVRMLRNVWVMVLLDPKYKGKIQGSDDSNAERRQRMLVLQHNKLKKGLYWCRNKRISKPWMVTLPWLCSGTTSMW